MMSKLDIKRLLTVTIAIFAPAITAVAQGGAFLPLGDDTTSSLGSFKIKVVSKFTNLFTGCPAYDPTTKILSSPTLIDRQTIIGRSHVVIDDTPFRLGSTPTGTARTVVPEDTLIQPPGYPCFGDSTCLSGPGTRTVRTEIRSLMMTDPSLPQGAPPNAGMVVRAGIWYNEPPLQGPLYGPIRVSPGKVESRSAPFSDPSHDFPAASFFDVYAKVDIPQCGNFPAATLYNTLPLTVQSPQISSFPPRVVYLHDSSSIVPILFLTDGPIINGVPAWKKDDTLGYFVLAGHGIGFGQGDMAEFQGIMGGQTNASCPIQ